MNDQKILLICFKNTVGHFTSVFAAPVISISHVSLDIEVRLIPLVSFLITGWSILKFEILKLSSTIDEMEDYWGMSYLLLKGGLGRDVITWLTVFGKRL